MKPPLEHYMARQQLNSASYGIPVPGFSHAILAPSGGRLLFVSGLTARDEQGDILCEGDAGGQTRQILRQLRAVLGTADADLDDVMQLHTYSTDIDNWPAIEAAWREVFGDVWPTSTFVEVSRLYDTRQLVEIDAVAVIAERTTSEEPQS